MILFCFKDIGLYKDIVKLNKQLKNEIKWIVKGTLSSYLKKYTSTVVSKWHAKIIALRRLLLFHSDSLRWDVHINHEIGFFPELPEKDYYRNMYQFKNKHTVVF